LKKRYQILGVVFAFCSFSCYSYLMSVTQTIEIPVNRRLTIDVPHEVPVGRTFLTFTPASAVREKMSEAQEMELINRNAERLNREALDVLSFQNLDL